MSCSPVNINRCFRRTCSLHLQGWRVSQARNHHKASNKWRVPSKCQLTFTRIHGVTSQKIELFISFCCVCHSCKLICFNCKFVVLHFLRNIHHIVLNGRIILSDELEKHHTKIMLETVHYLRYLRSSCLVLGSITNVTINLKIKK
jgi:hypothetical protein